MKKLLLTLCVFLIVTCVYSENYKVIANKDVEIATINAELLKNIYLGKKSQLDNGTKVEGVMLEEGDGIEEFVKNIVQKTLSQFKTFWKKAIFTGKGKPPRSFKTDKEVIDFVSKNSGTIGIISGDADDSVKILSIEN